MSLPLATYGVINHGGFVGTAIKAFTLSRFCHAFLVGPDCLIESLAGGVTRSRLDRYDGAMVAYNDQEPIPDATRELIWAAAERRVGTGYGWIDLAADATNTFGLHGLAQRMIAHSHVLDCSGLVTACYLEGGINLWASEPAGLVNPGDLGDRVARHVWAPVA